MLKTVLLLLLPQKDIVFEKIGGEIVWDCSVAGAVLQIIARYLVYFKKSISG